MRLPLHQQILVSRYCIEQMEIQVVVFRLGHSDPLGVDQSGEFGRTAVTPRGSLWPR